MPAAGAAMEGVAPGAGWGVESGLPAEPQGVPVYWTATYWRNA